MVETHHITSKKQWLDLRRADLTASDLGAYLGVAPWKTAAQLYAEKTGVAPEQVETRAMRRGRRDEPAIFAALKEERPTWILKTSKVYMRDPSIRLGCTPDAVAQDPEREGFGVVQCKSIASDVFFRGWLKGERDSAPEVPLPYLLQTLCEAHLAALAYPDQPVWACVAAHVRSAYEEDLVIIDVPRDPDTEQNIRDLAAKFWRDVANQVPPPLDYKRDSELVAMLHPAERGADEVDLSGNNELPALVDEYVQLRDHIKECEERKTEIGTMLKDALGDAGAGRVAGGALISWRTVSRPEHTVQAWSGRVLRVTKPRAKKEKAEAEAEAAQ